MPLVLEVLLTLSSWEKLCIGNLIWRGATTDEIYQAVEKREQLVEENKVVS